MFSITYQWSDLEAFWVPHLTSPTLGTVSRLLFLLAGQCIFAKSSSFGSTKLILFHVILHVLSVKVGTPIRFGCLFIPLGTNKLRLYVLLFSVINRDKIPMLTYKSVDLFIFCLFHSLKIFISDEMSVSLLWIFILELQQRNLEFSR